MSSNVAVPPEFSVPAPPEPADAGQIVRAIVANSALKLLRSLPQVHDDANAEAVHRTRVAARRLRSELRTFGSLLDHGGCDGLRRDLQWLASELGRVRDLDVLEKTVLASSARHPEIPAVAVAEILSALDLERSDTRRVMRRQLASERAARLREQLEELARYEQPQLTPALPAAERVIAHVRKPWRRLQRAVADLPAEPTPAQLHRVRIKTKRVRYAAEALAPIIGNKTKKFAAAATALQDLLGEFNDAWVAVRWLEDVAPRLDAPAAFGAGRLAQQLCSHRRIAHGDRRKAFRRLQRSSGWIRREP
jgi:CHAD domain-containing protein